MKAIVVTPGKPESLRVEDHEPPDAKAGEVLLRVLRVGICGTDRDIVGGFYGQAPPGSDHLVIGHESLCRVAALGAGASGFEVGELVVPTVRRNCPENCPNCSRGESDMCLTGHYTEHGIKGLHGFAREFAVSDQEFVVKLPESLSELGVLLEPLTIVEKAVTQAYAMQRARMFWEPKKALVLGAGPVGILATAILRLGGLEVQTMATRSEESLKARLVSLTGATYLDANKTPLERLGRDYDVILELTGNASVADRAGDHTSVNGVVSYLGIYRSAQATEDVGKRFTDLVLGNRLSFGSVNANKKYFEQGAEDLSRIRARWPDLMERMVTRKDAPEGFREAYSPEGKEGIKSVIEFSK